MQRRTLLGLGGMTLAGAALSPAPARAQTPKRGGTLSLRLWDPPHFDPYLQVSYKTHIVYSFTHSRLVKHKVGPAIVPGTFAIEGDLAESWSQPDETTYVSKLRRGVRWQPKPPVNGRELTADDVVYSVECFRTIKGNANASMLKPVDRVEAVDRYTVRFTLKEPYAWFSTCWPTRWPSASWPGSASRSSGTSGARRPPWAPARGCSIRIGPTSA